MSDYSKITSFTEKGNYYDDLITLMEENPMIFYDTSELDDLDSPEINDGVTQKTIQEWDVWIKEHMKKDEV